MASFSAFTTKPKISKIWILAGLLGIVLTVLSLIIDSKYDLHEPQKAYYETDVLFCLGILIFLAGLTTYAARQRSASYKLLAQFIADNGWSVDEETNTEHVATTLLGIGEEQGASICFSGNYGGFEMHAVAYVYVTGSGRSRRTHNYTNLCFKLNKEFPLILLDDKKNDFLMMTDLPSGIRGSKPLRLEGHFNKRFNVSVLPETEQQVLQLLTPDFMEELYNSRSTANVEIEGNNLFVITKANDFTQSNLRNLFGIADTVLQNVVQVSDTWQASSSPEAVSEMTQQALAPRRSLGLNTKKGLSVTVVAAIVYLTYVLLINWN